jgi:hypothetical protein
MQVVPGWVTMAVLDCREQVVSTQATAALQQLLSEGRLLQVPAVIVVAVHVRQAALSRQLDLCSIRAVWN